MSVTHAARHSLLRRYGNVGVGMCTQGDIKSEKERLLLARALSSSYHQLQWALIALLTLSESALLWTL